MGRCVNWPHWSGFCGMVQTSPDCNRFLFHQNIEWLKNKKRPWRIVLNQQRNFGNDSYPTSKINCTLRIFYTIHGAEDVYQHVFSFIIFFLCLIRLTNWNITNYPDTWSMNYSVGNYRPDQWHIDIVIPLWDSDTLTNWNISRTESPAWWKRHGSMIFAFPRSDRCPPETKFCPNERNVPDDRT